MRNFLRFISALCALGVAAAAAPNIVYILCDDLGYGDVRALNPERGKIATPHMDRLAAQGMAFTDAHSGSSVCTPTRYGILTGRYAWRTHLQSGVLYGYSKPLIDADRLTVPSLLQKHGYHTACIGKWHLGLDLAPGTRWPADFAEPIQNGPTARGFDSFFGISASLDMPPFVFIENDRFSAIPTVEKTWVRKGPATEDFEAVDVLPALTKRAVAYIGERAKADKPFFLYLALPSPHTPIVPTAEWQGKSGLGTYCDFVMQTDAALGDVLAALETSGLAGNTLVIFTSDNGCSPSAGMGKLEEAGHFPSAQFRGTKADIWEGGHRVPFLTRWPGKVAPGVQNPQLVCLTDLLATCAEIVGEKLPDSAGEDSISFLPALTGTAGGAPRESAIHHSVDGRFAIRQGAWKLALCPGSGGWSAPRDPAAAKQELPSFQLYDMAHDIGETANVQAANPEVVAQLTALLDKCVADGRSTPGAPQKNDAPVEVRFVSKK